MTDRDKRKLLKAGFNIYKIFGIPAKEIRIMYQDFNGSEKFGYAPHWQLYKNYKTVGATKEAFEALMQDDKNIDGAGL